jgi:hypothetical protein
MLPSELAVGERPLINNQLDLSRTGGIGLRDPNQISACLSLTAASLLQSLSNGEILLYLYFQDAIDLTGLQIDCDTPVVIGLYKYQTDIDFSDLGRPDVSLKARSNQLVKCSMTNCDYFSLHLKTPNDPLCVRSISLFGNKNETHTRRLEEVKIIWSDGCFKAADSIGTKVDSRYTIRMC